MSERYVIYVCDGCGALGDATALDRWGQCLVRHGIRRDGQPPEACARPARRIQVEEVSEDKSDE